MPTIRTQLAALGCAAAVLAAAATADAAVTVNLCLSGKLKAVGKSVAARTNCLSKDAKRGTPDPACLQKASDKFTGDGTPTRGVFNKLEAKYPNTSATPCLTFGDQGTFDGDIASYAASVPARTGSAVGRCDAAKIKCVGKYVAGITSCDAKAAKSTGTVDASCTAKVTAKLVGAGTGCLAKAAVHGDCTHPEDQTSDLQAAADLFIRNATCTLDPAHPCECPTSYTFTANGTDADFDVGWTGINHDGDMPSMSRMTLAVSGCPSTISPCGTCTLSGPLDNTGGAPFANHRCRGDSGGANGSWMPCTSDADCPGTGNACVFFVGPPRPDHFGFGELCTVTEIAGSITGTVDPDSGAVAITVPVATRSILGPSIDDPCPRCTGGFCDAGTRSGMPCVVQGHSASFDDDVSLDCPLSPAGVVAAQNVSLLLTTGTQTMTLGAGSPACTFGPVSSKSCFCDTCNNANAEVCMSDATCPPSGGNPGVCGGKRCRSGGNAGAPCAATSECPAGTCGRPGAPTEPNDCDFDGICTANPSDTDSPHEGVCLSGPLDGSCAMQPYRGCITASDCPLAGDSCVMTLRNCFTGRGTVGDTVRSEGQADPLSPTLATLYCGGPTQTQALDTARGLPGLIRITVPGKATME